MENFQKQNLIAYCNAIAEQLLEKGIKEILFNYLGKNIDDVLKTTVVEILNSMDVSKFSLKQINIIFKLMQDAKDFTKGKNELVYGNLLLVLTKSLCTSDVTNKLMEDLGAEWINELLEMLLKNTKRDVRNDENEQKEKDVLNCCFLHFICNSPSILDMPSLSIDSLIKTAKDLLKYECQTNPATSPPLEIEKSFIGDDIKVLTDFLSLSNPSSIQFFRIFNYISSKFDYTFFDKDSFRGNLFVNQKNLYTNSFSNLKRIILEELKPFSELKNSSSSSKSIKYSSSSQSNLINSRYEARNQSKF